MKNYIWTAFGELLRNTLDIPDRETTKHWTLIKENDSFIMVFLGSCFAILHIWQHCMQGRESDISLIFKSVQPDIYIFLKLIWHHCFCSLVKGQRNESAHKDRWRSYINCTKIIHFSSALIATGKWPTQDCTWQCNSSHRYRDRTKIVFIVECYIQGFKIISN